MRRPATLLLLIAAALPCFAAEDAPEKPPTPEGIAFFEKNIRPILVDRCQECHSVSEPESGLNLESRKGMLKGGELGPAIVPGKPKESLLIKAVNHAEYLRMPPKDKLATKELVNLAKWVKMGAPWPSEDDESEATEIEVKDDGTATFTKEQREFWAFQPPVRPNVPAVKNNQWLQSPIDNFVLSRLESAELKPAPTADKRTLLRRAAYDLTGLPPSQKNIDDFLADDSDNAFANVIDRLLATPQYGERWARHWLDVARYADTNGLDENMAYAHAWRYRDYVIDAFNSDKPYDRFVQEQIAGDLLAPDPDAPHDNGRFVATGFLAIGAKMLAEDDPMKMQMDIVDEQLNTVCQAFMGLTIGCCRCHDHKFDPLPAADYYSLAGIFKSSKTMEHHNVVAQWYNRKLSVPEIDEQIKKVDERLAENKKRLGQVDQAAREIKSSHVREHFGDYLLAAAELATFDSKMSPAPKNPSEPYQIVDGYLRIEAETFHRGNIQKTREGYGEGIGVVLSSGAAHLEYDVHADRAGTYELELRYAAEDSRPFKIRVNGKQVAKKAGGEITGSWNPDGQQWLRDTKLELKEGKNTIRFQSNKVFPHIDKLSIAYSIADGETWPFKNPRPLSVRQIVEQRGLHLDVVREWSSFLSKIDNGELHHRAFVPWVRLRDVPASEFAEKVADIATADETIPAIRMCLAKMDPQSVSDLADAYQTLLASVDEKVFNPNPKQPSPLHSADHVAWFRNDEQNSRRDKLNAKRNEIEASRPAEHFAIGVTEAQPEDLKIHLRGSHITLGKVAPRRFPQILSPPDATEPSFEGSGRLELAKWMTQNSHPLTSRVMANRIWHWHFGRGIVASVDNFGKLGDRPTHPQLLDWLATEFTDNGWSVKKMHRTIMLSSAYQMSTHHDPAAAEVDPENKLLWRRNRRRLSAEELRDSIVAIGEGLDETMGGTLLDNKDHSYVNSTGSKMNTKAFENRRRSIYLPVIRSSVYKVFQTMDFPDPAVINGRRQTSTVAPQALLMMNSQLVERHTKAIAANIIESHSDPLHRISAIYQRVLRRSPSPAELDGAQQFVDQALTIANTTEEKVKKENAEENELIAWQSLCRVLMSTNEFVYIE